ncbi:predicted protein [Plenodomus lingam JN3]|uniref:Predicted protein n=1 Tax=Leptosphaeria maculans (strain JN3 / isolate v23.1.3 / race Av1-4-5-6-7-8) TaxID=985895 RepID=E4ZP46_LEPMJ|nr:predicted protein [Plenodomus lingam JN3]CBX93575.1 predicted protein [Plenodomus lingam JN3]
MHLHTSTLAPLAYWLAIEHHEKLGGGQSGFRDVVACSRAPDTCLAAL